MASAEIRTFIEDRLRALDPTIDLDPGSPAQVRFVGPVLEKLGSDPFETDPITFVLDRFAQEFPNIYAGDPSVIGDVLVKPLSLMLAPFKRETLNIKQNQSLFNPDLLSEDDADALAANFFFSRDPGGFAKGTIRVFFPNPANVQIDNTVRAFTAGGLSFFPQLPTSITAEEMVFNQLGGLYYVDVSVQAEKEGVEYNIEPDSVTGIDGVFGWVKVTNTRRFKDGAAKPDTATFIGNAQEGLTERSLVARRGASARLRDVFQSDLRAVQIIGAGDPEMQRDILVAVGSGHAWVTGSVALYNKLALVQSRTTDGSASAAPSVGDTLYVYLSKSSYPSVAQADRTVKLVVEEVLVGPVAASGSFETAFLVRWSGTFPNGVTWSNPTTFEGGFIETSEVRISSLPDVGPVSLTGQSGDVHVLGHTDVYVRPILQTAAKAQLASVTDEESLVERTTLVTNGGAGSNKNRVSDSGGFNFSGAGVLPGDLLVIESGGFDDGTYDIRKVTSSYLYLTTNLKNSQTGLRFRVIRRIRFDPFEPKVLKYPFGSLLANDLSTSIGKSLVKLSSTDLLNFAADKGDVFRILTGSDAGDYLVVGFDQTLGGAGVVLNLQLKATAAGLSYEVFTALERVVKPLVRLKEIQLLDSSKQSTGITVPPAEPVAIVPTADFTSARVRGTSARKSGLVLPDITGYTNGVDNAAMSGNRRYSLGFDTPNGHYKPVTLADGSLSEFDYRSDSLGSCSWFLSRCEDTSNNENFPPIDPKIGDCLTIKSGPNKGSYLIRQVVKFKSVVQPDSHPTWNYFIQIYGSFRMDVFRQLITFLNTAGGGAAVTELPITGTVTWDSFFLNIYNLFGSRLNTALTGYGISSPGSSVLQAAVDSLAQVDYEWGEPARGVLRTYFAAPTVFDQATGLADPATEFELTNDAGAVVRFRPDPNRYTQREIVPARLLDDAAVVDYPRDLSKVSPSLASFTDASKPTVFAAGVQAGDYLSVHEEIVPSGYSLNSGGYQQTAVALVTGSTNVNAPTSAGTPFSADMVGALLFIEEGVDAGGCHITKFVDANNVVVDKSMTETTPPVVLQGTGAKWGKTGGNNKIVATSGVFSNSHIGKYITMYGVDFAWQGSFLVASIQTTTFANDTVYVTHPDSGFPAYQANTAHGLARWIITDAPTVSPTTTTDGTELVAVRPIRIYRSLPKDYKISDVAFSDPSLSEVTIATGLEDAYKQPYRIWRSDTRRVTPTEMNVKTDGPFFFFDTEVVSFSPGDESNIPKESYLTLKSGTYSSHGYRHLVDDPNLTYSTKESGSLELPVRILPIDSVDSPDNYIVLVGSPLQIVYERSDLVSDIQDFVDAPQDRVTVANFLARHFLPGYVSYAARYSGGSTPAVVGKDIFQYVDTLLVEQPLDVSEIEKKITERGGNPDTPTKVMLLLHDLDRAMWLEMSEDKLGGDSTKVPYNGTPRISFFIPGPNVSGQDPLPSEERIVLTQF